MKIGIVGNGFVGKATSLLQCDGVELFIYDIRPEACSPPETTLETMESCDLVFLALPTPLNHDGSCYTKILEDVIRDIKNPFKIIRSTVNVGFSNKQDCFFMPEFLTERNWKQDFQEASYWVMGLLDESTLDTAGNFEHHEMITHVTTEKNIIFKQRIQKLFSLAKNSGAIQSDVIHFVKSQEAETLKCFKNCFLSAKVGIMNEFYDFCSSYDVDFESVKQFLMKDDRIGKSHMNVPGYGNLRGFGGTCFPKDTHSLYHQFMQKGIESPIYEHILYRNDHKDRVEREWATDLWRTTIPSNGKPISLVTGGAGFIGSHLCESLLQRGHIVICLDNLYSGKMSNIEPLMKNENFLFKKGDVIHKMYFPKLDFIWHLACVASPPKYMATGYHTTQTSVIGTMNMIELAAVHQCKLLFSSTSEVYGDPLVHPQHEEYYGNVNSVGPRSCYDEGKRCAETLIYQYGVEHPEMKDKLKIVRIFNTYGPNMDLGDGRVITNFLKCILDKKPVEIYGNGNQTRSFTYIDDLLDGFFKVMESHEIHGPVNLGNPHEEFTINYLLSCFEKLTGRTIDKTNVSLPKNDPLQRKPCIEMAQDKLHWNPSVGLEEGLSKMLKKYDLLFENIDLHFEA